MDLETAKSTFLNLLPQQQELQARRKQLTKVDRRCKNAFKKHVKESGQPLTVGGRVFSFEEKEKVVLTMERVEQAFAPDHVREYVMNNTEKSEVFTMH